MPSLMNGAAPVQALDQPSPSLMNGGTAPLAPPPTQADAWDANSKAYTDWVAKERADGVAKGLLDPKTGWPTKAGLEDASRQLAQSVLMGTTAPGAKGLPMDLASRMSRAEDQGFTTDAYHGTNKSFKAFDPAKGQAQTWGPGHYFDTTPEIPNNFASGDGANVIPVKLKISSPFIPTTENALGLIDKSFDLTNSMRARDGQPPLPASKRDTWMIGQKQQLLDAAEVGGATERNAVGDFVSQNQPLIREAGHDAIKNGNEVVVFSPNQIRSQFANFDPKKIGSSNITAAAAGVAGGAAAAASKQDQTQ